MDLESTLLILSILGGLITIRTFIKDWREEPQKRVVAEVEVLRKLSYLEDTVNIHTTKLHRLEEERVDGIILARQVSELSEDVRSIQAKIDDLYSVLMRHIGAVNALRIT